MWFNVQGLTLPASFDCDLPCSVTATQRARAALRFKHSLLGLICAFDAGDLKPGNVLLTSARVDRRGFIAKLADFGLSHVAHGPIATNTWGVSWEAG